MAEFLRLPVYERWVQQEELTARIVEDNARNSPPEEPGR